MPFSNLRRKALVDLLLLSLMNLQEGWLLSSYLLKLTPLSPWKHWSFFLNPLVHLDNICLLSKMPVRWLASDPVHFMAQSMTCTWEQFGVGWQGRSCDEGREPDQMKNHLYLSEHGGLFQIKDKWMTKCAWSKVHLAQHPLAHRDTSRSSQRKQAYLCFPWHVQKLYFSGL